jgi:hypothetical protein
MIGLSHVLFFSAINHSLVIGRPVFQGDQLQFIDERISHTFPDDHLRSVCGRSNTFVAHVEWWRLPSLIRQLKNNWSRLRIPFEVKIDSSIYIVFSLVLAIQLMYEQITIDTLKSPQKFVMETLLRSVVMFSAHIPFCITSFVNLLVSKTFRKEVKDLICWKRTTYGQQRQILHRNST